MPPLQPPECLFIAFISGFKQELRFIRMTHQWFIDTPERILKEAAKEGKRNKFRPCLLKGLLVGRIHADAIYFIRRRQSQLANVFYSFKHYCCIGLFDTLNPTDFSQDNIGQLFGVMCPDRTHYHKYSSRG